VRLSIIEPSVQRTVGREDLLSVRRVDAQQRTTGAIQPCIHAARGISADIAPDLLVARGRTALLLPVAEQQPSTELVTWLLGSRSSGDSWLLLIR
jgi:hypothetical protein